MSEERTIIPAFVQVGEEVPVEVKEASAEMNSYLILIKGEDDNGDEFKIYEFAVGRTDAYNYARRLIEELAFIDLVNSTVLVDGKKLEERLPLLTFMQHCEKNNFVEHEGFSVDEYN